MKRRIARLEKAHKHLTDRLTTLAGRLTEWIAVKNEQHDLTDATLRLVTLDFAAEHDNPLRIICSRLSDLERKFVEHRELDGIAKTLQPIEGAPIGETDPEVLSMLTLMEVLEWHLEQEPDGRFAAWKQFGDEPEVKRFKPGASIGYIADCLQRFDDSKKQEREEGSE